MVGNVFISSFCSCSIASSSGVSSSSGTGSKKTLGQPGLIDNSSLVEEPTYKVPTLTGEGNFWLYLDELTYKIIHFQAED